MLKLYLAALLIGGVLVAMSVLSGGEGDHDLEGDDLGDGVDLEDGGFALDAWLPLTSLRFWTFFLAFGGMTGVLLTLFASSSAGVVAALSGFMGFATGVTVTRTLRSLRKKEVTGHVEEREFVGKTGRVMLPVSRDSPGQIRLRVKGRDVDLTARMDDDGELSEQQEVIVYEMENGTALVASPQRKKEGEL